MFNKESKLVDFTDIHKDNRGSIFSVVNQPCNNVSIIETNSNSIRSNHYHKKDWHYMLVLEGELDYFYYSSAQKKVVYIKVTIDQIIFTPNLEVHATFFPIKTKLLVVSGFPRDTDTYEADTVRVDFINENNVEKAKKGTLIWRPTVDLF